MRCPHKTPHELPHTAGLRNGGCRVGLTLDRGRYYFVMNVPKQLCGKVLGNSGQSVRQIRHALRTTEQSAAKRKTFELEELARAAALAELRELGRGQKTA